MKFSRNHEKGFTLVEAVVATAVFAFVFSSIVGVYISTIQIDRKSRSQRELAQSARFITEFLTKEVRNGQIDYNSYPGNVISGNNNDLYLINQAGESEHIYPSANNCSTSSPCDLVIAKTVGTSNLNSSVVQVTNMRFYVQPNHDPYGGSGSSTDQPKVTMILELSAKGANVTDKAKINLETTFSTRSYPSLP